MFISRELRIALLTSLLWHLFWLSSVSIIFLPRQFRPRKYVSVYFLGSILSKPISFNQAPWDKKSYQFVALPAEAKILRESEKPLMSLPVERAYLNFDGIIDMDAFAEERPFAASSFDFAQDGSTLRFRSGSNTERSRMYSKDGEPLEPPVSTKGLAQEREIIFKPTFPEYPEWMQQELRVSPVIFNIYISGEGLVQEIVNVQASGNPELDVALARYIKSWRFAPVFELAGQWQAVKINLDSE